MMRHSVNNNTPMGLVISLCSNSNHLISYYPKTASNFKHLFSCGTIVSFCVSLTCLQFVRADERLGQLLQDSCLKTKLKS